MQIQQGDVIIEKIENIPTGVKVKKNGILAEGEATGHHHALTNLGIAMLFLDEEENMFLRVKEGNEAEIVHQEHAPVRVPAGNWKINQVYEYDPFEEEARRVVD